MRLVKAWLKTMVTVGVLALSVSAQSSLVDSDFFVTTADGVSIHVHRKLNAGGARVPLLLIHGTFADARVWDFPGRSVMSYFASIGYDTYALDLRGMGTSDHPTDYSTIDVVNRVQDALAVAKSIVATTGRRPVVFGWSQGGLITGLLAATAPNMVAGVGFFSVPEDGFFVPPPLIPILQAVVASGADRYAPAPDVLFGLNFAVDPATGKPTISPDAFATFVSISEADSVHVLLEEISPDFFNASLVPAWPKIKAPALVVDGELDAVVGQTRAQALFNALGSKQKKLIILPQNAHAWFVEDNFAKFLSQF